MSFGGFFSYASAVKKNSNDLKKSDNKPDPVSERYFNALLNAEIITSKERKNLLGHMKKHNQYFNLSAVQKLKLSIDELQPIILEKVYNVTSSDVISKNLIYDILDTIEYEEIFKYISMNYKGTFDNDTDKMVSLLLRYLTTEIINQKLSFDDINCLMSYMLKVKNSSYQNIVHIITCHFALLILCYAYVKEEFVQDKNCSSFIYKSVSSEYHAAGIQILTIFPRPTEYSLFDDYSNNIFEHLMKKDNISNVTLKHKSKIEQIIHMTTKYLLNILRVTSTIQPSREDTILNVLRSIQNVTNIDHFLISCPLNLNTMLLCIDKLLLNQKILDLYKKRILIILTTNQKACGCKYTDEIVEFEAVFSNKFIFAGSDYAPLQYKYVKQKGHLMKNTHYEPVFQNNRIVKLKYYIKPDQYSDCIVSNFLNCFKMKNKEHQNYILNYYDCDVEDIGISVYGQRIILEDNKSTIIRMRYDMSESEKEKCKKYYFKVDDIININFKVVVVNKIINTNFKIDTNLFFKLYDFDKFTTPEYESFFKKMMGCEDVKNDKYCKYLKHCFPNLGIKISKLCHSPAEKKEIIDFSQKFYDTYVKPKMILNEITTLPVMLLTNYVIYNINVFTVEHKRFISNLFESLHYIIHFNSFIVDDYIEILIFGLYILLNIEKKEELFCEFYMISNNIIIKPQKIYTKYANKIKNNIVEISKGYSPHTIVQLWHAGFIVLFMENIFTKLQKTFINKEIKKVIAKLDISSVKLSDETIKFMSQISLTLDQLA